MTTSLRVEIFPADLDVTVSFYVDVLAFRIVRDERAYEEPYLGLQRGDVHLGAAGRSNTRKRENRRPPIGVELVLEVDALHLEHRRVMDTGWPLDEDLTDRPWGLRDFRLLDPDGYYWRITSRQA